MMATSSSPGPTMIVPGSPSDASSLRAAALRTLKSGKRRRPASGQRQEVSLARPVPQDTLQLDYGQDDDTSDSVQAPAKAPSLSTSAIQDAPPAPQAVGGMDVDMREEGEISDEEPPQAEATSKLVPMQTDDAIPSQNNRPSNTSVSPHLGSPAPALLARISMPQSPASNSPSTSSALFAERSLSYPPPEFDQEHAPVAYHSDAPPERIQWQDDYESHPYNTYHHDEQDRFYTERYEIYPGLIMTGMEYTTAKDIVLDLLGWGVPPQYLVDCGLSKDLVICVFTELQLKLPLELDGPHETDVSSSSGSPSHADSFPGNHLIPHYEDSVDDSSAPGMHTPEHVSHSMASSTQPAALVSPTPQELQDMERQRRQELLARKKAALATRKAKPSVDFNPSSSQIEDSDMVMAPSVVTEAVENFLSSIGPISQGEEPLRKDQTPESPPETHDLADSDEIPGLGNSRSDLAASSPRSGDPTPSPPANNITTSSTPVQQSPELSFGRLGRSKGVKRPVAFDFVDVEDRYLSKANSSILARRIEGPGMNFSSIKSSRRCVIDLSDSEDDDTPYYVSSEFSKRSHTVPTLRAQHNHNNFSSRLSPAFQAPNKARSATVTPSPDPAVLQLEINNLREKIGFFEEKQKRKMLAKLNTASLTQNGTSTLDVGNIQEGTSTSREPSDLAGTAETVSLISGPSSPTNQQVAANNTAMSSIGSTPGQHNRQHQLT
ncbi:hypothetical protein D9756_004912 [Leucocoprinus leucothites]|uniref:Uncharacterized protein n=1 Tax=Leucocoprinus leucothites TaxID=201217 RepID=A0A8H5LK66_9AGAR|nr:hypothetical protein D9756_004912 [Leucoagaricus leucothites]